MCKHLHNDLAEKSGKVYVVLIVPVATPLGNTTSASIGVEGKGWWGATKCHANPLLKRKIAGSHQLVPFSSPHITQSS